MNTVELTTIQVNFRTDDHYLNMPTSQWSHRVSCARRWAINGQMKVRILRPEAVRFSKCFNFHERMHVINGEFTSQVIRLAIINVH
jgi:hypothetical protein